MFEKLSKKIFQKRVQQHAESESITRQFVNYSKASTILLLFECDDSENNQAIAQIINNLRADGKKVTAIGFLDKKKLVNEPKNEYQLFYWKDFDSLRRPKPHVISLLKENKFDLLLDISTRLLLPLEYIILLANARFRAGMPKSNRHQYDFCMDMEHYLAERELSADELDFSFLYNQILFFLKKIQTND